jgi:hypothetical protein
VPFWQELIFHARHGMSAPMVVRPGWIVRTARGTWFDQYDPTADVKVTGLRHNTHMANPARRYSQDQKRTGESYFGRCWSILGSRC